MKQWSVPFCRIFDSCSDILQQIEEIHSYVIAISEDEVKCNMFTALHKATYEYDLLPEVSQNNIYFLFQSMIGLMMHFYNLDYNTAALHYINKTLPI